MHRPTASPTAPLHAVAVGNKAAGTVQIASHCYSLLSVPVPAVRIRGQELCESGGGRPGLPVPNKPTVYVDVKQHFNQPTFPSAQDTLLV